MRTESRISYEDMLGVLRTYDTLFDSLGFAVRLEPDEFSIGFGIDRGYACTVIARYVDNKTGRLLWGGYGRTRQAARKNMLRQAHSEYGMPLTFSEVEAKIRIALTGEDAFWPVCRKIEMFAGKFERK